MENILNYVLAADGISPKEPLCGGYQGEHRATALVFTPDEEFSKRLSEIAATGSRLSVRIDFITEAGEVFFGQERSIDAISEPYFISGEMSASGLDSKAILKITETDQNGNLTELLRVTAPIYFMAGEGFVTNPDQREEVDMIEKKTAELLAFIEEKCSEVAETLSEGTAQMREIQATSADQLKKTLAAKEAAEDLASEAERSMSISKKAGEDALTEAQKARNYCISAGELTATAGSNAKTAALSAERAEAAALSAKEYMSAVSDKQDKFAEVTERDGTVTVKSTVSNDRPPQAVFKNGLLELLAMHLQFGDGMGEVSLKGFDAPDDSLNVNVNGNRIRNLANPIFEGDAVNKAYLDGVVGQVEAALDNIIAIQNTLVGGEGV